MASIGTLTAHLGLDVRGLQTGAAKARTVLGSVGADMGGLKGMAMELATALAGGLGLREIVKLGEEFDDAFRPAIVTMEATAGAAEHAREVLESMRRPTEAVVGFHDLAIAGFDAGESLRMLPSISDLAVAHTLPIGQAAQEVTQVLKAFELQSDRTASVVDLLTLGARRGRQSISSFAEGMAAAAPTANSLGYSLEETAGYVAVLGSIGITGSRAGMGLAMSMKKANQAAIDFNLTEADLLSVLEGIEEKGGNVQDVMDAFGARTATVALALTKAKDEVRGFQSELGHAEGVTKHFADVMRGDLGESFKTTQGVIEDMAIETFDEYEDTIVGVLENLTTFLKDNKAEILDFMKAVGFVVVTLVGGVERAVELLISLGETVAGLFLVAGDAIGVVVAVMAGDFGTMRELIGGLKTHMEEMSGSIMKGVNAFRFEFDEAVPEKAPWTASEWGGPVRLPTHPPMESKKDREARLKEAAEAEKADREQARKLLDLNVGAYRDILAQADLTQSQITEAWAGMTSARLDQIEMEKKADLSAGMSQVLAQQRVEAQVAGLWAEEADYRSRLASDSLSAQVTAYEDLLSDTFLTADEMTKAWERYKEARLRQIEEEVDARAIAGKLTPAEVEELRFKLNVELNRKQIETFGARTGMEPDAESRRNVEEWGKIADDGFQSIGEAAAGFFTTQKRQWADFHDSLRAMLGEFVGRVLKQVADQATAGAGTAEGIGSAIVGLFTGGGLTAKGAKGTGGLDWILENELKPVAAGGVFHNPTPALIGEAGPEAVIPLSRLRDAAFLGRLAGSETNGQAARSASRLPPIIIQTPDVQSFKASSSQIAARMALAMRMAERNL